ncbi:hypothetical protein MBANPS3_007633 [Mucor bainieri]
MTNNSKRLPLEIWRNILAQITFARDLCQCRLVCKSWDAIAERAMLTTDVSVYGTSRAAKLYRYLKQKPDKAQLIKDIEIDYSMGSEPEVQLLFQLAFTPNMRTISFTYDETVYYQIFNTLLDIIKKSPDPSAFKLERLPDPHEDYECYLELVYLLRNSIQTVRISPDSQRLLYLDNLRVFKQLTDLNLTDISFDTIPQLENILKNCPKLTHLELEWELYHNLRLTPAHETCLEWAAKHVQQVQTMEVVSMDTVHRDLFDYVAYKYPNIQFFHSFNMNYDETFYKTMMKSLKNIKEFSTNLQVYQPLQLLETVYSSICDLDDKPTQIKLHVRTNSLPQDDGFDEIAEMQINMKVDLVREINIRAKVQENIIDFTNKTLIDQLSKLNTNCEVVDLNILLTTRPESQDDQPIDIWCIANISTLKALTLVSPEIAHKHDFNMSRQNLCQLESLNLQSVKIDAQALPQISQQFPHLRHVAFSDCAIIKDNAETEKEIYHIDMPYSSLKTVSIQANKEGCIRFDQEDADGHWKKTMEKLNSAYLVHVEISLLDLNELVYLRLGKATAVIDSKEFNSMAGTHGCPVIKVTCQNAERLTIKFGTINIGFNIEKHVSRQRLHAEAKAVNSRYEATASITKDEGLRSLFAAYKTDVDNLMAKVESLKGSAWGTSADQDSRFSNKEKKLLKSMSFPPEFDQKVDMKKVNLDVIKPWISNRITELLGFEDEVVIDYTCSLLEEKDQDPKRMQINLTGFLESKTQAFLSELWNLLLSAQNSVGGIPTEFIEQKKQELRRKQTQEDERRNQRDSVMDTIRQKKTEEFDALQEAKKRSSRFDDRGKDDKRYSRSPPPRRRYNRSRSRSPTRSSRHHYRDDYYHGRRERDDDRHRSSRRRERRRDSRSRSKSPGHRSD